MGTALAFLRENDFADYLFFRSRPAGVHCLYPAKLIAGLDVFGDAFGFGEPGGNEVDLLIGLTVDIDEVLRQSALHQS